TVAEAIARGYRACRLCDPLGAGAGDPNWLAPLVHEIQAHADTRLRDDDLSARGLDPVLVRRTFKRRFGMTFHASQREMRLGPALRALAGGTPTLDAGLDAGFDSDSGFRAAFARVFGDAPGRSRGRDLLVASSVETPLGPMLAIAGDDGLRF